MVPLPVNGKGKVTDAFADGTFADVARAMRPGLSLKVASRKPMFASYYAALADEGLV